MEGVREISTKSRMYDLILAIKRINISIPRDLYKIIYEHLRKIDSLNVKYIMTDPKYIPVLYRTYVIVKFPKLVTGIWIYPNMGRILENVHIKIIIKNNIYLNMKMPSVTRDIEFTKKQLFKSEYGNADQKIIIPIIHKSMSTITDQIKSKDVEDFRLTCSLKFNTDLFAMTQDGVIDKNESIKINIRSKPVKI